MTSTHRISRLSLAALAATTTILLAVAMPAIAQDAPVSSKSVPTQEAPGAQNGEQAPVRGGSRRAGQDGGAPRGGRGENPSMGGSMKAMNRALKSLTGSIEDASKTADNLKLIGEMERGCILAKNAPLPADILKDAAGDAAKAEVATRFRKDMIRLAQALLELELAVMNGKLSAAKSMLAKIDAEKDHAHEEFGVDEDE